MTATPALTSDLQQQVLKLEDDLRRRVAADAEREGRWKQEHQRAVEKERTAASWVAWRDDRVTQAAVAWVLTTVFVRFCEDNALVKPVWISGPEGRRQEALDAQLAFFRSHPEDTDREWLIQAVEYLAALPATKALVDQHSALHFVSPSGDAVTALLDFWRRREGPTLVHDLAEKSLSTRFLGDLYQDLSKYAKDTFALLQTPVFVEEFILDQTLEPALKERPLEGFKLIDPTCGSGHFLLGAFDRLLERWHKHAPNLETRARVQTALDAIHGVDLNPFAVAIARFRLTVAALNACGETSLEEAPAFTFHLAVGDSLIHGPDRDVLPGMADRAAYMSFTYATEDGPLLLTILEEGRYDVVVGNPPYITVKDKALNKVYRAKYASVCSGAYPMSLPFIVLFFALAKRGECPGWVGQITSNSFMKRKFGVKLVQEFLSCQDLRLVADTSRAYIPGHGTPTIIIIGRSQSPVGSTVRAVLGVRGEPYPPDEAAKGLVWTSIINHIDDPGWDGTWVTVIDIERSQLSDHPWSLTGGGAIDVLATINSAAVSTLGDLRPIIGRTTHTGLDDFFYMPINATRTYGVDKDCIPVVFGEHIRDYAITTTEWTFFPYGRDGKPTQPNEEIFRRAWRFRTPLAARVDFEKTLQERGLRWFDHSMFFPRRFIVKQALAFSNVATHNHFSISYHPSCFTAHSPAILLPDGITQERRWALLGMLNSSTACFWLKQNSHDKGNRGGERSTARYSWESFYEFTGTTVHDFPLSPALPVLRGRVLDELAQELAGYEPSAVCADGTPSGAALRAAYKASERVRALMVAIQEELDWEVYRLYGLIDEDLTYGGNDLPGLALGERVFEVALARAIQVGQDETAWFTRHGSTPITQIPERWPPAYRDLVQRRLELIASNPSIRLLEKPEYKRRWAQEPWDKRQERALRNWLLDRMEDRRFWFDAQGRPLPRSVAQLADDVTRDADMVSVLALWEGRPDVPVTESLVRLLADEAVPFLAAYRYKDSGLRKREAWEETWALQRREDAGERVGPIAVPPKYTSADFRKNSYWQARGKLDVPKERFILYPAAGRETDPTPLLGWAGWDQAQQSLALSLVIGEREQDGWGDERLVPLVAGLAELQPWVEQWHAGVDPAYGVSLAAFCREQLAARMAQVGKTLLELAAWRPDPARRGRRSANKRG